MKTMSLKYGKGDKKQCQPTYESAGIVKYCSVV